MTIKAIPPNSHITLMQRPYGAPRFHFDEGAAGGGDANAAAAATPWHAGIEAEFIGHAQNKGWKLDNPKDAFSAAAKVARDLEKHFGAPADRIVRLPAPDAKPEDIRAFHQRLGAPADAKEYDFSAVKDSANNPLAAPIADALRAAAFDRGLSKDAALSVAQSVAKAMDGLKASESADMTAKVAEQKAKLKESWGTSFEYNKIKAMDGARRLGMDPETVASFEGLIGYAGIMETLRKIGVGTTEATFIDNGLNTNGQVTTKEGAVARKQELMADVAWRDRYLAGGVAEKREMTALNMMITGTAA
jgi:hypothetical protein